MVAGAESVFCVDHRGQDPIHGGGVLPRVAALLLSKPVGHVFGQPQVPIVAAKLHVAVGGDGLDLAGRQPQQRDVEGAAAKIINQQRHFFPESCVGGEIPERLAKTQCGGRRLVDDVEHREAGHFAGVGRALAAGLVKVGRHRDDHAIDLTKRV